MADGIIGYPFDSILTFDEEGNPSYDRAVPSKVLKTLISKLFTTGVMPNPSNNLLVTAGTEGMTTIVEEGFCVIEGGLKLIVEPQTMMHQASDTHYDRIDTVVMRWDNNDNVRHCGLFVVAGTPATSPVRPTLTREGSIYEIGLADVLIKANSTVISANRITDTRYDNERCGVVRSISEYDTTYIYQQVQADLAGFKENEQAEFVAWFETIRGILDEEVAGHLQLEIDDLKALIKPIGEATVAENTWTAVEAKKGDKIARLQMNADGNLILFQSTDNGETWEQKEIGEKPTVRWNEDTKMYQVLLNGQWYDDRYFDPIWDGYIYNNGVYQPAYFDTETNEIMQYDPNNVRSKAKTVNASNIVLSISSPYSSAGYPPVTAVFVFTKAIHIDRACRLKVTFEQGGIDSGYKSAYPNIHQRVFLRADTSASDSNTVLSSSDIMTASTNEYTFDLRSSQYIGQDLYLGFSVGGPKAGGGGNSFTIKTIQMIWD